MPTPPGDHPRVLSQCETRRAPGADSSAGLYRKVIGLSSNAAAPRRIGKSRPPSHDGSNGGRRPGPDDEPVVARPPPPGGQAARVWFAFAAGRTAAGVEVVTTRLCSMNPARGVGLLQHGSRCPSDSRRLAGVVPAFFRWGLHPPEVAVIVRRASSARAPGYGPYDRLSREVSRVLVPRRSCLLGLCRVRRKLSVAVGAPRWGSTACIAGEWAAMHGASKAGELSPSRLALRPRRGRSNLRS